MKNQECTSCEGKGVKYRTCVETVARVVTQCHDCNATGRKINTYYGLVLTNKDTHNNIWLHPTLFDTLSEAQRFKHREYFVIKIIEVKV